MGHESLKEIIMTVDLTNGLETWSGGGKKQMGATVKVQLKEQAQPIVYSGITNTYQKGDFYCLYRAETEEVIKHPIESIFRVIEPYGFHGSTD
jgi:hypothetical protein